jgi:hypothetical protein
VTVQGLRAEVRFLYFNQCSFTVIYAFTQVSGLAQERLKTAEALGKLELANANVKELAEALEAKDQELQHQRCLSEVTKQEHHTQLQLQDAGQALLIKNLQWDNKFYERKVWLYLSLHLYLHYNCILIQTIMLLQMKRNIFVCRATRSVSLQELQQALQAHTVFSKQVDGTINLVFVFAPNIANADFERILQGFEASSQQGNFLMEINGNSKFRSFGLGERFLDDVYISIFNMNAKKLRGRYPLREGVTAWPPIEGSVWHMTPQG